MRRRSWGWLLALPAALATIVVLTAPFSGFHQQLLLAGTPGRFTAAVVRGGRSNARLALWLVNVFALAWLLTVPRAMRAGLERWSPERRRTVPLWLVAPSLAIAGGWVILAGNAVALFLVGKGRPPTVLVLLVACLGWARWLCMLVALAGVLALVIGPLVAPFVRPTMRRLFGWLDPPAVAGSVSPSQAASQSASQAESTGPAVAVCVSGDGPAAAAVAVGALGELDAAGVMRGARWLVTDTGMSAGALAWNGAAGDVERAASRLGAFRARRFSFVGGVSTVASSALVVIVAAVAGAYLIGAGLGALVRTHAIHPDFPFADRSHQAILDLRGLFGLRLLLPPVVLGVVAYGLRLADRRRRVTAAAAAGAGAGAAGTVARVVELGALALAGLLLGAPVVARYGRTVLLNVPGVDRADRGALVVLAALLVVLALCGMATFGESSPTRIRMIAMWTFAAVLALIAGTSLDAFARGIDSAWVRWSLPVGQATVPVVVVAALAVVLVAMVPLHRLWLIEPHRRRVASLGLAAPMQLMAARTRAGGGTGSVMTMSPTEVRWAAPGSVGVVSRADYPTGSWWDGFPRTWSPERFAALGHRPATGWSPLGEWYPNPRNLQWFTDPNTSPRLHHAHVVRRLLGQRDEHGQHDEHDDAFVFLTDAGTNGAALTAAIVAGATTVGLVHRGDDADLRAAVAQARDDLADAIEMGDVVDGVLVATLRRPTGDVRIVAASADVSASADVETAVAAGRRAAQRLALRFQQANP